MYETSIRNALKTAFSASSLFSTCVHLSPPHAEAFAVV